MVEGGEERRRQGEREASWFLTFIQWGFKKRLLSIQRSGAGWAIHHSPSKHLPRDHTHPACRSRVLVKNIGRKSDVIDLLITGWSLTGIWGVERRGEEVSVTEAWCSLNGYKNTALFLLVLLTFSSVILIMSWFSLNFLLWYISILELNYTGESMRHSVLNEA